MGLQTGGGAYIRVGLYPKYYIRWQMDGLISGGGGLKTGGFKVGFYGSWVSSLVIWHGKRGLLLDFCIQCVLK